MLDESNSVSKKLATSESQVSQPDQICMDLVADEKINMKTGIYANGMLT